jgi:hypothetical protein
MKQGDDRNDRRYHRGEGRDGGEPEENLVAAGAGLTDAGPGLTGCRIRWREVAPGPAAEEAGGDLQGGRQQREHSGD